MAGAGARGVTLGYLAGAAIATALWLGIGIVLWPLMAILALAHGLAAAGTSGLAAEHHRWLAAHHLWSALALAAVVAVPIAMIPTLVDDATTVLNTLASAPHPVATLTAAWPPSNLSELILAGLIFACSWFLATLWISLRLLRRGLRWAEGAPVG